MGVLVKKEESDGKWAWIPGYEGDYEISENGKIISYTRPCPRIMTPYPRGGYFSLELTKDGKKKLHLISRLVLRSFIGEPPSEGMEAAHNNGVKSDNRLSNLRWATPKENCADKIIHGTSATGDKNWMHNNRHLFRGENSRTAILSDEQRLEIIDIGGDETAKSLAAIYGVTESCIYHVRREFKLPEYRKMIEENIIKKNKQKVI